VLGLYWLWPGIFTGAAAAEPAPEPGLEPEPEPEPEAAADGRPSARDAVRLVWQEKISVWSLCPAPAPAQAPPHADAPSSGASRAQDEPISAVGFR
jgi:hypothetical protein